MMMMMRRMLIVEIQNSTQVRKNKLGKLGNGEKDDRHTWVRFQTHSPDHQELQSLIGCLYLACTWW
jgi:hypothetical protein